MKEIYGYYLSGEIIVDIGYMTYIHSISKIRSDFELENEIIKAFI